MSKSIKNIIAAVFEGKIKCEPEVSIVWDYIPYITDRNHLENDHVWPYRV